MSEMVERVARYLHDSSFDNASWEQISLMERNIYRKRAREQIEVMREPTTDMIKAGLPIRDPADVWVAMIDAALAGGTNVRDG